MKHSLDYTALAEPLTKADVTAYKQSGLYKGFQTVNLVMVLIFAGFFLLIVPYMITIFQRAGMTTALLLPLFMIGAFTVGIWQLFESSTKRRAKLYKFALRNHLTYLADGKDPGYTGMIFDNGHSRQIDDAVRLGDGTEIGNYTYITGSGKNSQTHTWGYVKTKLVRRLPHMVLDAKSNNFWKFSNLSNYFDRSQVLSLEGNFDTFFTLYAPKQYERDALYVFTPDVMTAMIDYGKEYDIEIVDDDLYIYSGSHLKLDQPEFYERILSIVNTISSELLQQSDYYADERVGDRTANIVADEGRRLKSGFNWFIVVVIILIIYFNIIQPLFFR